MIKKIPPSTNYRHQLLIAILLGAWLYLFLAIIGPFDVAELSLEFRIQLMVGYGFVTVFSYLLCIPVQNELYRRLGYWNGLLEMTILFLFSIICLPASYRQNNPYGMGLFLYGDNPAFGPVIGHSGEQTGAAGQLMLFPEKKTVIVVLSNTALAWREAFQLSVSLFPIAAR